MPRLEDLMVTNGFPVPLDQLNGLIDINESFNAGARKCAAFFRGVEERFSARELFSRLLEPTIPPKWLEYVLFSLLDTGAPYLQIAEQALRLKCLRRLLMRIESRISLSDAEMAVADGIAKTAGIQTVADLMSFAFKARTFVSTLAKSRSGNDRQRSLLVFLIRSEVAMLKERINRISDGVDVYSIKEMARILPKVRTFDENAKDSLDLADVIERNEPLGKRTLTFETASKIAPFDAWIDGLGKDVSLAPIREAFILQRQKLAATRSLVALASLTRWIDEAEHKETNALSWVIRALREYKGERFAIESGPAALKLRKFIDSSGAWLDKTVIAGNFSERLYSQWIGFDMLTRPLEESNAATAPLPTFKEIVAVHINNDKLVERMLENEKVYTTMGIVEYIARMSRSVTILSKIAGRNYLYAGAANSGVPRALIENPCPIPIDLLRQFLKPSFFSGPEMRNFLSRDIRPEVLEEIRAVLGTSGPAAHAGGRNRR
jgi:hypothetical protein